MAHFVSHVEGTKASEAPWGLGAARGQGTTNTHRQLFRDGRHAAWCGEVPPAKKPEILVDFEFGRVTNTWDHRRPVWFATFVDSWDTCRSFSPHLSKRLWHWLMSRRRPALLPVNVIFGLTKVVSSVFLIFLVMAGYHVQFMHIFRGHLALLRVTFFTSLRKTSTSSNRRHSSFHWVVACQDGPRWLGTGSDMSDHYEHLDAKSCTCRIYSTQ